VNIVDRFLCEAFQLQGDAPVAKDTDANIQHRPMVRRVLCGIAHARIANAVNRTAP
jgi:hypothetical protein